MIVLSHPTGNVNVRQAALAFREADLLGEFWTCVSWNPDSVLDRFLPRALRQQLARRSFAPNLRPFLRTAPVHEIGRLLLGLFDIDMVMRGLDRKVAARLRELENCNLVYAYEDGALETFRAGQQLGVRRVYDLPIGYWRVAEQIYAEEREREPEWAPTLTEVGEREQKLARKEEELALADHVVVASTFTKETLSTGGFAGSISVIPYGAPLAIENEIVVPSGRLHVLFVGSLGQRKGLSYLLKAIDSLAAQVELTLLGRKTVSDCRPLEAATRRHRWIPTLPHREVLREMQRHDVLVLPSLFEGFGLVILEAMAQGLVVITTPHTAGPDLIAQDTEGFVVPIRSAAAIAQKLEMLATDPERLREMKIAARRKAGRQRWDDYRRRLAGMARELMSQPGNKSYASNY